jgi:thioredoxin reductase (NADPH)
MAYDLIIIGGGAAGLTAGIYASRGRLKTLLVEKGMVGGLTATTDLIENYPGFPDGINGMELMDKMKRQAQRFGTEIVEFEEVESMKPAGTKIGVQTAKGEYSVSAVIVASGTVPKSLNIPGEEGFRGRGVSYCATCDGPLFRDKDVVVVGCGNSGLQEGEYLLKFVKSVTFVEFLPYMTAEKILQERLSKEKRTKFLLNHMVTRINGKDGVDSVTIRNRQTNEEEEIKVSGVFVYVGLLPNSDFLKGVVELDDSGCVITNEQMETSVPGIFVAGDVRSKQVRQIAAAVGEGTLAAIMTEKYIEGKEKEIFKRNMRKN